MLKALLIQRRPGTTCIPIGARAISASLMCWIPKGMPMIVTKQALAQAHHKAPQHKQRTLSRKRSMGPVAALSSCLPHLGV